MDKFINSFKENAGAIITALIACAFVVYYLAIVIPEHKAVEDKQNVAKLQEFNNHLNEVLKDYINAIDVEDITAAIKRNAQKLSKTSGAETPLNVKELINNLKSDRSDILQNWSKTIIVRNIKLEKIKENAGDIILETKIHILLDTSVIKSKTDYTHKRFEEALTIPYTKVISKHDLKQKLKAGAFFPDFLLCSLDSTPKKNKIVLINCNIDIQESDSLDLNTSKQGARTFSFSNKRFYKHSFMLNNTDFDIVLIGAINAEAFEARAKRVDPSALVTSILIILLLFLSVPLIKPLISSAKEKLSQFDLINTTLSVGIFIVVLVSFLLVNYLGSNQVEKIDAKLCSVDSCVSRCFNSELQLYKKKLDTIKALTDSSLQRVEIINLQSQKNFQNLPDLQNYFVMNLQGDLVKDAYSNANRSFRKNFRERDYFKALVDKDTGYSTLSAAYSKYTNRFIAIFARKLVHGFIEGFAYTPKFTGLVNQRLDLDYGYLICDHNGFVLLHSDSSKKLNENIYSTTDKPIELFKLRSVADSQFFTCRYNNRLHRFYGKRLNYKADNSRSTAIYVFSFKKLDFENNLKVYTLVNGLLLSLIYTFGIVMLAVLYSMFFYAGHISLLSRYHIYWLFPDDSRSKEFIVLKIANLGLLTGFFLVFFFGYCNPLYISIIGGINVVFFNFVLISQRVFVLNKSTAIRNKYLAALFFVLAINFFVSYELYLCHQLYYGLGISLVTHFIYLAILKREHKITFEENRSQESNGKDKSTEARNGTENDTLPLKIHDQKRNDKEEFTGFLASVISYHYFLVPIIILFSLFSGEVAKLQKLNNTHDENSPKISVNEKTAPIFESSTTIPNTILLLSPPSSVVLYKVQAKIRSSDISHIGFLSLVSGNGSVWKIITLALALILIWLIILGLTKFYTSRFFFADLSEAYKTGYFIKKNDFENLKVIIPPFNSEDLVNIETYERVRDDENKSLKHGSINTVPDCIVSAQLKMELIMMDNLQTYEAEYLAEWNKLTYDEKVVMSDFATYHFVNYKNKFLLVQLMHKGLVIADPLTGRLRVMNYGFENFVIKYARLDKAFVEEQLARPANGLFIKWKIPILIAAFTILLLVTYLYKQSFDQILIVGGVALSAIGSLTKLLDAYKTNA